MLRLPPLPSWHATLPSAVAEEEVAAWQEMQGVLDGFAAAHPGLAALLPAPLPAPLALPPPLPAPVLVPSSTTPILWQPLIRMNQQPRCVRRCVLHPSEAVRRGAEMFIAMQPPLRGLATNAGHNAPLLSALRRLLEHYDAIEIENDYFRSKAMKQAISRLAAADHPLTAKNVQDFAKANGIGGKTLEKIEHFLRHGNIPELQGREDTGSHFTLHHDLKRVWGIGRATADALIAQGIDSIAQLKLAVFGDPEHGIPARRPQRQLANGRKGDVLSEDSVICLRYLEDIETRIPRAEVEEIGARVHGLAVAAYGAGNFDMWLCGSYRRGKPTCGDVDVLLVPSARHPGHKILSMPALLDRLRDDDGFVLRFLREGENVAFGHDSAGYFAGGRHLTHGLRNKSHYSAASSSSLSGGGAGEDEEEEDEEGGAARRDPSGFLEDGVVPGGAIPSTEAWNGLKQKQKVVIPEHVRLTGVEGTRAVATAIADANERESERMRARRASNDAGGGGGGGDAAAASGGGAPPSWGRGRGRWRGRGGRPDRSRSPEAPRGTRKADFGYDTESGDEEEGSGEGSSTGSRRSRLSSRSAASASGGAGGAATGVDPHGLAFSSGPTSSPAPPSTLPPPGAPPPPYQEIEFLPYREYRTETVLLLVQLPQAPGGPKRLARRLDIKVCPRDVAPFALMSFTGTDYYNRSTRLWAHKCGWQLSDTALRPVLRPTQRADGTAPFYSGHSIRVLSEADIAAALGVPFREPSERDSL